jgi:hypothetical protein
VRVTSRERSEASALYAAPVRPIRHFHVTRHIAFVVVVDDIQRTLYPGKELLAPVSVGWRHTWPLH